MTQLLLLVVEPLTGGLLQLLMFLLVKLGLGKGVLLALKFLVISLLPEFNYGWSCYCDLP